MYVKPTSAPRFAPAWAVALLIGAGSILLGVNPARASAIYDSIPAPLPPNVVSLGYEATSASEFGDDVIFAGSNRFVTTVALTMSAWAPNSDFPSMPAGGWSHPITLNIYAVDNSGASPAVGTLLSTVTQSFLIPWRPEADPSCPNPTAWRAPDTQCYNGYAFNITFNVNAVIDANEVVFGIVYNTADYGPAPIHSAGPYNSLNVGLRDTSSDGPVPVGADRETDALFWNTSYTGFYTAPCPGGTFCRDTAWTPYTPAIRFNAGEDGSLSLRRVSASHGAKPNTDRWSAQGEINTSTTPNFLSDAVSNGLSVLLAKTSPSAAVDTISFAPGDCVRLSGGASLRCKNVSGISAAFQKRLSVNFFKVAVKANKRSFTLPLGQSSLLVDVQSSGVDRPDTITPCSNATNGKAVNCRHTP
jgi:hypothetical protein